MQYLSNRVESFSTSPISKINAMARRIREGGEEVIFLNQGKPDFDTPECVTNAVNAALNEGYTKYTSPKGLPELRDALVQKLTRDNCIPGVKQDEVLVTNGARMGLFLAIETLIEEGDEVLGVRPFFGSYPELIEYAGGNFVTTDLVEKRDKWVINRKEIQDLLSKKTKIILINNPQNPVGKVWTKDELDFLAELACEYDCFILSDEVYEKILFDSSNHVSIASLSPNIKSRTILVNSFSKTYAMTGWRLGYVVAERKIVEAMANLYRNSGRCATAFVQKAGIAALTSGKGSISDMVNQYSQRRNLVIKQLAAMDGLQSQRVEGTFFAFPKVLSQPCSSFEFTKNLLREVRVALTPGSYYGYEGYIRISFANSYDKIKQGLTRLHEVF